MRFLLFLHLQTGEWNGIMPTFARHSDINIVTSGADRAFPIVVSCSSAIPHADTISMADKTKLLSACSDVRIVEIPAFALV